MIVIYSKFGVTSELHDTLEDCRPGILSFGLEVDLVFLGDLPHLDDECLPRVDRGSESAGGAFDGLRVPTPVFLENYTAGVAIERESVSNRCLETNRLGYCRVNVKRVHVARQPVKDGYMRRERLLDHKIWLPLGASLTDQRLHSALEPEATHVSYHKERGNLSMQFLSLRVHELLLPYDYCQLSLVLEVDELLLAYVLGPIRLHGLEYLQLIFAM